MYAAGVSLRPPLSHAVLTRSGPCARPADSGGFTSLDDYPEGGSAMPSSLQLARQWWSTLDHTDRQRVWNSRHSYLAGDLVESMAKAGVPVVSDGRWSCVSVGPTGFTVPVAVQQLLDGLSQQPGGYP